MRVGTPQAAHRTPDTPQAAAPHAKWHPRLDDSGKSGLQGARCNSVGRGMGAHVEHLHEINMWRAKKKDKTGWTLKLCSLASLAGGICSTAISESRPAFPDALPANTSSQYYGRRELKIGEMENCVVNCTAFEQYYWSVQLSFFFLQRKNLFLQWEKQLTLPHMTNWSRASN